MTSPNIDLKEYKAKVILGQQPAANLTRMRKNVCNVCPSLLKMTRTCKECFCFVDLKTAMLNQSCPLDKW